MKVIRDLAQGKINFRNVVLAIGVFDGLHRGHQQLIKKAIARARKIKGTSMVMTFWPHPVHVLRPEIRLPLLVSLEHRLRLMRDLGVDVCVVAPFTLQFSRLSPKEFIEEYLVEEIQPVEVFVGYDFRFGHARSGGLDLFQKEGEEYGFKVNILGAVKGEHHVISSTRIRELISCGDLNRAARLLGRLVSLMGTVCRGDARGKTLGFPTANIHLTCEVIPPCGVYAVQVVFGKRKLFGMANIGRRPSFQKEDGRINVEVHIFNFHQKIYGQEIIVEFFKKIRDERMFNSKDQLIEQLKRDEKKARKLLSRV